MYGDDDDVSVGDDSCGGDEPVPQREENEGGTPLAGHRLSALVSQAHLRPQRHPAHRFHRRPGQRPTIPLASY